MVAKTFTITEDHILLSRRMYVSWWSAEFGAPAIDPKRPYGNGDVENDMLEILGIYNPRKDNDWAELPSALTKRLHDLHQQMKTVIQIWLCTGAIRTGTFSKTNEYDDLSWNRV